MCVLWISVNCSNLCSPNFSLKLLTTSSWGSHLKLLCSWNMEYSIHCSRNQHSQQTLTEGRILANGWTHLSSMTIFVPLFIRRVVKSYHSDIKYHMKVNIKYSVALTFHFTCHNSRDTRQSILTSDLVFIGK